MNAGLGKRIVLIKAALVVATIALAQPLHAQNISGKQKQAEAIPSSREALNGRLFFSREQRERLDRVRAGGDVSTEQIAIEPRASRINGFVKRSDGETAVWVDGKPRYGLEGGSAERLSPQDVGGPTNKLKILSGNTGTSSSLEIGRGAVQKMSSHSRKNNPKTKSKLTPTDHRRTQ